MVEGLDERTPLTLAELDRTDRVVAMAGVHPFIKALGMGADVIIGGRSSDAAIFAAAALYEGFPESHSYYLGKVLECASFCAEPYMAKESVIGTITHNDVTVTAMHPEQRCTVASVAGHAMYERSNAYYEYFAGGTLDMTGCRYEQVDPKTTRVTGQVFVPTVGRTKVKLEGSGKVGERFIGIVGIRDPYSIQQHRPGDRLGPQPGRGTVRRASPTSSSTTSTARTASWATWSPCARSARTSCA